MVDTTDNRGPNMKHIMEEIQNTICNDMMSWDELADRVLELESQLTAAAERERVLVEVLDKLVNAIDKVHDDPEYKAVWTLYQCHVVGGIGYKGKTYTRQLSKARAALVQVKGG